MIKLVPEKLLMAVPLRPAPDIPGALPVRQDVPALPVPCFRVVVRPGDAPKKEKK